MAEGFEYRIFQRALRDTAAFASFKLNLLVPALLVVAGGALDLYFRGLEAVKSEFAEFLFYTLAPLGAFFLLLFLWNLWLAPFKIVLESIPVKDNAVSPVAAVPEKEANWAEWAKVPKYSLWQAALLWLNKEPVSFSMKNHTSPIYNRLMADLESGKLPPVDKYGLGDGLTIGPHTEIERKNLIKYAEAANEKPKFLFP